MKYLTIITRVVFSCYLVYMVFDEAGFFTAFCVGLLGLSSELHTIAIKHQLDSINMLAGLNKDNKQ